MIYFNLSWYSLFRHWNDPISNKWKPIHFGMTTLDVSERCISWWYDNVFQAHLVHSCSDLNQLFLKGHKALFFCMKLYSQSIDWIIGILITVEWICHHFLASYVGRARMCRLYCLWSTSWVYTDTSNSNTRW